MTSLIIRVDAVHETGLAHAARCSRLIDLLPERPRVHVLGQGEALSEFFPYDKIVPLKGPVDVFLKALVIETEADAVLVDQPVHDPVLWSALDALPQLKRLMVDDFGSDAPADLVFNGTVIEDYHRYPNLRTGGHALCGGEYALIAPVFAKSRHDDARKGPVIAICGGGDRAADWAMQLAEQGPALAHPPPFHHDRGIQLSRL
jgi:spore coat polysaccharide biosynthesis predicted glycosyltransferase SpsG